MAALAAAIAVASAGLLQKATGEELPSAAELLPHREHGPVCSLASRVSGGQRTFGLNVQGEHRTHHGLRRHASNDA